MKGTAREDIVRMFDAGIEPENIADALKLPAATVVAVLLRAGRELAGKDEILGGGEGRADGPGPEVRAAVIDLYQKWVPVHKIAKKFGMTRWDVYAILNEEGVPIYAPKTRKQLARERFEAEVLALYETGWTIEEILERVGMPRWSHSIIYEILHRYNVPMRGIGISKPPVDEDFVRKLAEKRKYEL